MSAAQAALLIAGGLVAGVVNTLAGGASLLTVPLLVFVGLPGTMANGSNRVGVLVQNLAAAWRFRAAGVSGLREAAAVLLPIGIGSVAGAFAIAQVASETFEKSFGVIMVLLLFPILWRPAPPSEAGRQHWSGATRFAVFLGIGLYGGAFQAGVGIALLFALSYGGYDLVRGNGIKVIVNAALTLMALPVFIAHGQVAWLPALLLAGGFALGGEAGARLAVRGGERVIRPVLAAAVLSLAGRMVGLY